MIERDAQERVLRYRARAERDGRVVASAEPPSGPGWFCPATVAADLTEDSPVLSEEIFGPLLAVQRVADVARACEIVDALPFALTGGLFTRNPETVRTSARRHPWATCTSTARSPARWSPASRSAAIGCRARA